MTRNIPPQISLADTAWVTLVVLCFLAPSGCSKEEVKKFGTSIQNQASAITSEAQTYVESTTKKAKELLPASGSVSLRMDPPMEIDQADISVIDLGDRDNVVQISTYDLEKGPTAYPCLLIHGTTDISEPNQLSGSTAACDIYLQETSGGAIKMSPPGRSVQVTFGTYDKESGTLKISVGSTPLIASDRKSSTMNGGSIIAKVAGS